MQKELSVIFVLFCFTWVVFALLVFLPECFGFCLCTCVSCFTFLLLFVSQRQNKTINFGRQGGGEDPRGIVSGKN